MGDRLLYGLHEGRLLDTLGKKAEGLSRLERLRTRIPRTWVVTFDGYRRYRANDETVLARLAQELDVVLDPGAVYAVRSSANIEDTDDRTFAGQFKTALDVSGTHSIMQAVWSVWAMAQSEAVAVYVQRMGYPVEELDMAVIIQEMVRARVAGVAFSCNPVTGGDEIMIECVPGTGAALVQGGITPLHWVNRWGRWTDKPESDVVDIEVVAAVAEQTRRIANKIGYDVDLEWAWDGGSLYWLQMRPITSVHKTRIYSNTISKELLPGMIKPLVWSINVPQTNGVWVDVISEVIGKNDIDPISLAKQFHYRTYFDVSTFGRIFESLGMPRDSLDRMVGVRSETGSKQRFMPGPRIWQHVPRMLRFGVKLWTIQDRAQQALQDDQRALGTFPLEPPADLDARALLRRLDDLCHVHRRITYYNVLVPLLLRLYEAMLQKGLARAGQDLAALDLVGGLTEIEVYDLPARLASLNKAFSQLDAGLQQTLRSCSYDEFQRLEGAADFREAVDALLQQFGHLSDSVTDFSNVTWHEQPELVLQLIADYSVSVATGPPRVKFEALELGSFQRRWLRLFYHRARHFRYFRDAFSTVYAQGLGLIRATFLALGDRFVRFGTLKERDDIFYLYADEIREVVADGGSGPKLPALVERRKAEMALSRDAELPPVIYGDQEPPLMPPVQRTLKGVATSPGYHTGTVKVVGRISEFQKLTAGDVLVIPYSDVAWTPLFARAGAVVAESGGMLSHSSIIAREYGIPAVVSVAGALSLPDLATVTVNGYTGEVILHQQERLCES